MANVTNKQTMQSERDVYAIPNKTMQSKHDVYASPKTRVHCPTPPVRRMLLQTNGVRNNSQICSQNICNDKRRPGVHVYR